MDTTNYDNKMEELRSAASNGQLTKEAIDKVRVGRPKGPEKVVYKRNVEPELVSQLDALVKGSTTNKASLPVEEGQVSANGSNELKEQIKSLLEDNERLSKEIVRLEDKVQRVARLTDNEKLILWIRKYDELKKVYDLRVGGSEFSQ